MGFEEFASVCTFDCPDACSLTVGVDDGHIVKVRGSDAAPYTDGVICNKVARYTGDFVHGEQRLLYPLRRIGPKGSGQFERVSWEGALDAIYERVSAVIGRWGPQAVMPLNYAGPHGFLAGDSMSSALLSPARRHPALPAGAVRRGAQRGLGGDLRRRARMPAGIRRARPAQRRLGQQRDGHQSASCPVHSPGAARRRQAGGRRPAAHQDRRTGRSASATAARHRCPARLVGRRRTGAVGVAGHRLHCRQCAGRRGIHGAREAMAGRTSGPGLRAGGKPDPDLCALARRGGSSHPDAGQWARTRTQWRQWYSRRDRLAGIARQARQRERHRPRREQCLSQDPGPAAAAGSAARRHPHAQHQRYRPASRRGRHRPAIARALHLQPQPDRRAP